MGGNTVKCRECGTHYEVVGSGDASMIKDAHMIMNKGHVVTIEASNLNVGTNMRELETAQFFSLTNLLAELE